VPRQHEGEQGQGEVGRGDQQQVAGAPGAGRQRDERESAGEREERSRLPGRGTRPGPEQAKNFRSADAFRLMG
jgi:hypothetical protein